MIGAVKWGMNQIKLSTRSGLKTGICYQEGRCRPCRQWLNYIWLSDDDEGADCIACRIDAIHFYLITGMMLAADTCHEKVHEESNDLGQRTGLTGLFQNSGKFGDGYIRQIILVRGIYRDMSYHRQNDTNTQSFDLSIVIQPVGQVDFTTVILDNAECDG